MSCYASSMAFHCARYSFSPSPGKPKFKLVHRSNPAVLFSSLRTTRASYSTLVSEVQFLLPSPSFALILAAVGCGITAFLLFGD